MRLYHLVQDDTELGRIMHDLHCKKADEMHSQVLAKRVHELKETALSMAEEGMNVKTMARLVKVSEKDVQKWIDETLCVTK